MASACWNAVRGPSTDPLPKPQRPMAKTFCCDAALSDLVLQAARAALPANAATYHLNAGIKNHPPLILLTALLDASKAVAAAVADNAWDDCRPIPDDAFRVLKRLVQQIDNDLDAARQCPNSETWSMPSCSNKELV